MSEAAERQVRETERRILDSAVPIYRQEGRGTPSLIGSAVLLRICHASFLCTAAHVLDAREGRNLYLPHGDELHPFEAHPFVTEAPATGRREDKYDIAIDRLDEVRVAQFTSYRFVTLSTIDQNEVPRSGCLYSFVGYPVSKNKSRFGTTEVKAQLARYTGGPVLEPLAYEKQGFNTSVHLLVEFDRKRMVNLAGEISAPPDPKGISGGPVWKLGDLPELENGTNVEKLVGIGMEYRSDALIAIRISFILECIRAIHNDIAESIPRSHWVGAGVTMRNR